MQNNENKSESNQARPDLFISDLHLCESRPEITRAFLDFLSKTAKHANSLYILGDLFEYWAGDDDLEQYQVLIAALKALASCGVNLYFMHGNRDFLIGARFCNAASIQLLADPSLITLQGKRVLLSHGDALCTDDVDYQHFRYQVRTSQWQQDFLMQPLGDRKQQIEEIRLRSEQEKSQKLAQIMDVNQEAVAALFSAYNYPELLIHGHTHRPNQHKLQIDGHQVIRWVLGDWYEQGSYLICDPTGCKVAALPSP